MWWLATTVAPLRDGDRALQLGADREHRRGWARTAAAAARARSRASGAAAAAGRPVARATESSQRMWIGAVVGQQARRPAGRAASTASSSSWAIGSSLRLPLVITSGRPTPASSRWCSGRVRAGTAPSSGKPGRDRRRRRSRRRVGGREHDRSARRRERGDRVVVELAQRVGGGEVGDHHRERLVVAGLAAAQLGDGVGVGGVDGEVVAADALHRDDRARRAARRPRRRARRRRRPRGCPAGRATCSRGPHSGHALGWAWKRRSAGSSYSAWHAGAHREAGHRRGRAGRRARASTIV